MQPCLLHRTVQGVDASQNLILKPFPGVVNRLLGLPHDQQYKPTRSMKDITQLSSAGSSHDCGALSRVVMVRKTDQRVINHRGSQKDPICEVITMETIQTYKGHKPDRTVVFKEKFDLTGNDMGRPLSTGRLSVSSPRLSISPLRTILTTSAELERKRRGTCDRNNNTATLINNAQTVLKNTKVVVKEASKPISRGLGRMTASTTQTSFRPKSVDRSNNNDASSLDHMKSPSIGSLRPYGTQSSIRGSATLYTEFQRECLKAHNEYRRRHGVLPLKLSTRLCRYADEWAKVIAARGVLVHRSNSQYGENIFCSWSSPNIVSVGVSGQEPVEHWYSEIDLHIFGKEPATLKTGHFTQVIWKDSRELGVGVARNRSGQVFVVANYDPPGNYIGSFSKNVPPVGGFEIPKIIVNKLSALKKSNQTATDTLSVMQENIIERTSKLSTPSRCEADGGKLGVMAEKHVRIMDENDLGQFDEFAVAILKHHNEFRRKHGAPNL
uniref:SCP domain-containing protein n=1 Tax=Anopheles atroparvus TaxID=41427 RepID=A0AAG5DD05_ANOAO